MTTTTYRYSTTLEVISCGACAIPFGIPDDLYEARLKDGKHFFCPNGHNISYSESENKRLARELKWAKDRAASDRARADQVEASLRATKGHVTRLRKKVLAGECPFCGQHLRDLERHITRQHKDEPEIESQP